MAKTIIKVENLGKKYVIGERQAYYSLRDTVSNFFVGKKKKVDEFWALKDVNFEVKQGESVGIIGRNGAGKSTLLKILSRITPPTTGKITLEGRVASLLEVGTGFNPELTGRENIYLNGAILGMKRAEIKRKFDEIVDFSEVEKFLDMPVKHYSSGMYMRLAFAVAAHLESEILIVDEVLAVGDAQFQKKCLGKMGEVTSKEGRTVLFVSHNTIAVKRLCKKAVWLNSGKIIKFGTTSDVLNKYIEESRDVHGNSQNIRKNDIGKKGIYISKIILKNDRVKCGDDLLIKLLIVKKLNIIPLDLSIGVGIDDSHGERIVRLSSEYAKQNGKIDLNKCEQIDLVIPKISLMPGKYSGKAFILHGEEEMDTVENAFNFEIEEGDFFDTGKFPRQDGYQGKILIDHYFNAKY